ncbi:MAG: helix-turn-helix transcriptional regulator [Roseibium sp.]|uniref:helix-turn-helix domain-containing protein n=1 Tax=Roseibium sp. TaxID=1936156 RepID=UPI003299BDD5
MDLFDIGERVREERKARKMTQSDLAEAAGVSRVRVNQLEAGNVFDMRFGSVSAVLEALDLSFRIGSANSGRPTLDDIQQERDDDGPGF